MKIFECGHCSYPLYFENNHCDNCGRACGYGDDDMKMLTFDPENESLISDRENIAYKYCKNKEHEVCNWLVPKDLEQEYCSACQLNRTIPNLSDKRNFPKWKTLR